MNLAPYPFCFGILRDMANTICKFMADDIRGNGRLLSYCLETTKSDLNWKPSVKGEGRSILEQADEVAKLNKGIAAMLGGGQMNMSEEPLIKNPEEAAKTVMSSATALADAIEKCSDDELSKPITLPFGTFPTKIAVGMANMNMVYHWGQTNYVELLDGDKDFRIPPEFMNN